MAAFDKVFQWLMPKLLPNGRAFRVPENGWLYRLFRALAPSFKRLYDAARGIQDVQLPDNDNFTIDDAHDWYRRLGIYDSGSVSLPDMKAAIRQKLSFPGNPLNQQSAAFIQAQLQAAGFNVFVYPNRFSDGMGGWITKSPADVLGLPVGNAYLGSFDLGQLDLAATYAAAGISIIANYIEESKDALFSVSNYRGSFFIAGATITTFASVPAARKMEFRQLLLKLKALQSIGFVFVNYP